MKLLQEKLRIKHVELSNRIVLPPMATSKAVDGDVSRSLIDYYDEKSKGGYLGLIITEHAYISMEGKASPGQASIARDSDVEGLKRIVDVIHQNGSKVIAQISHAGSSANPEVTNCPSIGPSATINQGYTAKTKEAPQEMDIEDIKRITNCFADAAKRAKEAGFDGVEIHSAHGYLLNQFFSPLTNNRTDEYGGCLENRVRIHIELIHAVRHVVGDDFLIALRLGACDYIDGGSTLEDGVIASKLFEQAGIDLLDISGGFCGYTRPGHQEQGYFSELTEAIKKEIHIPVILTGGIIDGDSLEQLLVENKADLIGVGRAILKNSNWAREVLGNCSFND